MAAVSETKATLLKRQSTNNSHKENVENKRMTPPNRQGVPTGNQTCPGGTKRMLKTRGCPRG